MKAAEEIMEILDAYDLTGSLRDAGELAGCSHHTVKHYVERRAAAGELDRAAARPQLIDAYLSKVEEWVERGQGRVRADVAHEKLLLRSEDQLTSYIGPLDSRGGDLI